MAEPGKMSLKTRLMVRSAFVVAIVITLLFLPAGSLKFWQAWVFSSELVVASLLMSVYFYRHDRRLIERRLESQEKESSQKVFRKIFVPLWIGGMVLAGFDFRFGWSFLLFPHLPPLWLVVLGQALVLAGYFLVFQVLKANSFASSVVQVEAEQKVISTGPYRLVRHPMYSAASLIFLATPLALGSYVALPVFALLIPLLVFRLLNEEKLLRQNLPGYAEYCSRTRFRLVPFVI